ncbi:hypothetical protein GYB29_11140 [bacterium]|nr:hypothetical protein [Balneola sp.]MBR9918205.1 hypothetical protein [bacterium]
MGLQLDVNYLDQPTFLPTRLGVATSPYNRSTTALPTSQGVATPCPVGG